MKLTEKHVKLIRKLKHPRFTPEYIAHWVNRNDNVATNAPAALIAMEAKGFLMAIDAMAKLIAVEGPKAKPEMPKTRIAKGGGI